MWTGGALRVCFVLYTMVHEAGMWLLLCLLSCQIQATQDDHHPFHQSHWDTIAVGYSMLWVAGGNCVTASAVTATAACFVTLLTLITGSISDF